MAVVVSPLSAVIPLQGSCAYSVDSYARWQALWQRRRRGLVKERIDELRSELEAIRAEQLRRIDELEQSAAQVCD